MCPVPQARLESKVEGSFEKVPRPFAGQSGQTLHRESVPLLKDPWAARNAYIKVVLENRPKIGPFLKVYGRRMNKSQRELVLNLLEMQRNRMLMYTSCGWFFDDISGIEALQILRYAARVVQIAYPFDPTVIDDFLKGLSEAKSNVKPNLHGDQMFDQKIRPQVADLANVAAHVAISSVFEEVPAKRRLYCYDVKLLDSVGRNRLNECS